MRKYTQMQNDGGRQRVTSARVSYKNKNNLQTHSTYIYTCIHISIRTIACPVLPNRQEDRQKV